MTATTPYLWAVPLTSISHFPSDSGFLQVIQSPPSDRAQAPIAWPRPGVCRRRQSGLLAWWGRVPRSDPRAAGEARGVARRWPGAPARVGKGGLRLCAPTRWLCASRSLFQSPAAPSSSGAPRKPDLGLRGLQRWDQARPSGERSPKLSCHLLAAGGADAA